MKQCSWTQSISKSIVGSEQYGTSYSYDKHGNMLTLQRNGKKDAGTNPSSFGLIDNLTMTYAGNQLIHTADAIPNFAYPSSADFKDKVSPAGTIEYTYNKNGAMRSDLNKGITEIQYNSLNLPRMMVINSSEAKAKNYYTYSASGVKLRTEQRYDPTLKLAPVGTTTPANDGFQDYKNTDYVGNIVYETSKTGAIITNRTRILIDGGYIENGVYHYYLTDHLGNNRVVVNQSGTVTQKNHYYPFGMAFAEKFDNGTKQPYKYNGKELDQMHGLNLYDYSARYYESAIGRFTTVDPLAEKYYSISPYVYVMNNPLKYIDPDGREVFPVHGTWSNPQTWKNLNGILSVTGKAFGDNRLATPLFSWSGGNYSDLRSKAANELINHVRAARTNADASEPITLVGHSHGGNVAIEAINAMVKMDEFQGVEINLMTINTPVRKDYQLSEEAGKRTNHVNVYDGKDPVQVKGGNGITILPDNQSSVKGTGEYGKAGRTFENATNVKVDNPQNLLKDYHNSHNRIQDWIDKIKTK
jgi:RHS repeat-associated protein